jgi:hypothetical protein
MNATFPYHNLHHYLEELGLQNAGIEVIEEAKRKYKKLYQRYYRSRSRKHQVNVLLKETDFQHLKKKADTFNLKKPTQYLLHLINCDREGKYTAPNFLIDLEIGILRAFEELDKVMAQAPETCEKLSNVYQHLEDVLLILSKS